jgi:hypothetical protein
MLHMSLRWLAFLLLLFSLPAQAAEVSLDGITFGEGSDNMRLLAVTGTGSVEDPYVVLEEIHSSGEAVLLIRIDAPDFGSRLRTLHAVGFALRKVVINKTSEHWDYFALELEFEAGQGSDYYDGLSFAQSTEVYRPFLSNRFARVDDMTEPRDVVRFTEGGVAPGEQAAFQVSITHTSPQPSFRLVQHVRRPFAEGAAPVKLATRELCPPPTEALPCLN